MDKFPRAQKPEQRTSTCLKVRNVMLSSNIYSPSSYQLARNMQMSISIIDYSLQQLLFKICHYGFFYILQNFVFVSIVLPDFAANHSYLSLFSTSIPYFHQLKIFWLLHDWYFFSIFYRCFFEPKIIALSFASFCHCDNTEKFQKLINFNFKHFEIKIRSFKQIRMQCN